MATRWHIVERRPVPIEPFYSTRDDALAALEQLRRLHPSPASLVLVEVEETSTEVIRRTLTVRETDMTDVTGPIDSPNSPEPTR